MKKLIRTTILLAITINTTNSFGLNRGTTLVETIDPQPFTAATVGEGKPILYLPGFATPGSIWERHR